MSSRHSALLTGAPFATGVVYADSLARGGCDLLLRAHRRARPRPVPKRIRPAGAGEAQREDNIRREERHKERARIVHDLHDTMLQGFLGASLLLHQAVEQTPADCPSIHELSSALQLVRRAIDEGRAALRGIHMALPAPSTLEEVFANLLAEVTPVRHARLRLFAQGKSWPLKPAVREQLCFIVREAVINALRHSGATKIEVEIRYSRSCLRVFVRDNGCGIDTDSVLRAGDSHWGLCGMRHRAEDVGARFGIWSRRSAGTEVRILVPVEIARDRA
jgi:signal transduction histidine kinase